MVIPNDIALASTISLKLNYMLRKNIMQSSMPNDLLFQRIQGCSFGLLLGIVSVWFSPLLVLGTLVSAICIYAIPKRPEIALLGILIATSSIVFEEQLPLLPVGNYSLHIPDILLLGSIGLFAVRWLVIPEFRIVRTPLDWPLLIFYGVTLFTTVIGILQSSVEVKDALRETRVLSYYLTFFIVTNLVRNRRQLNFMLNGLFILATIVAAAMVVQFLLGNSTQFIPGHIDSLVTQEVGYGDIIRIVPPGWTIVLVAFVTVSCILCIEKFKIIGLLKFLQCGLLGMALLLTFFRTYWAVLFFVIILLAYLFRGVDRQRFITLCLVATFSATMMLLLILYNPASRANRLIGASLERLATVGRSETYQYQDSSLNWRKIENGYAFTTILSNPWTGLGMGFTYRPWDSRIDQRGRSDSGFNFRKFIHNGHLWILLQSGLFGYLSFMWLSLTFLMRGFRFWRSISNDRMRGVVLGFTLVYMTLLIGAITNSTFMKWDWTPVIGILMGTNEVILRKVDKAAAA